MTITGLDHLEFYVGDARQTAYYLCTAFGFRILGHGGSAQGLTGQCSLLLGQGEIRIVLTSGLAADHAAAVFVGRHGDGVANIAMSTDDAAATYAELIRRGARPVSPPTVFARGDSRVVVATVSGFGDVAHHLVERHGPPGEFLPGAIEVSAKTSAAAEELLEVIDHIAIVVPAGELVTTAEYYSEIFDFPEIFKEYIEVGGQGMDSRVVQSPARAITFTIIEPDPSRRPGQIDDYLRWHAGAGVQHVALRTHDIVTAVRTFGERGVGFAQTPASYYDTLETRLGPLGVPIADLRELGILVDADHWGRMYQIFTHSMVVRRTLFLEIIERQGALTFGSRNIQALYEAKERELGTAGVDLASA